MSTETTKTEVPKEWDERIAAFATATGKSIEDITKSLLAVTGEPSAQALEVLSDKTSSPDTDIKEALKSLNIPSGVFNKSVTLLRGKVEPATVGSKNTLVESLAILPKLPDDASFIKTLQVGGVLKVGEIEVISAVKAAIAQKIGLFTLPEKISEKMEAWADKQEEPVGDTFIEIQKMLTQKRYGDVLTAMGMAGNFMSETRKKELFNRININLWKAIGEFHNQLVIWQDTWIKGMNPSMLLLLSVRPAEGGTLPPGMAMTPPDVSPLRDGALAFADSVNKIFSGLGIPIAKALAYDATRIIGILENKDLPVQIGVTTKDQMLKELGVNIGADVVRLEQSVSRYVLSIMNVPKVPEDAELQYFSSLYVLGQAIPWEKVGVKVSANGTPVGIGNL